MESNWSAYWKGYLQIRIRSDCPERFFNICASKNIKIWEIRSIEEEYEGFIRISDFKKLLPLVRKTKTRLWIRNRCGFPFFLTELPKTKRISSRFLFLFSDFIL